jgi:hypothetical protein
VADIALDGFDDVGNEIGPALQLNVDAGPGLLDHLPGFHEAIVDGNAVDGDGSENGDDDKRGHESGLRLLNDGQINP